MNAETARINTRAFAALDRLAYFNEGKRPKVDLADGILDLTFTDGTRILCSLASDEPILLDDPSSNYGVYLLKFLIDEELVDLIEEAFGEIDAYAYHHAQVAVQALAFEASL